MKKLLAVILIASLSGCAITNKVFNKNKTKSSFETSDKSTTETDKDTKTNSVTSTESNTIVDLSASVVSTKETESIDNGISTKETITTIVAEYGTNDKGESIKIRETETKKEKVIDSRDNKEKTKLAQGSTVNISAIDSENNTDSINKIEKDKSKYETESTSKGDNKTVITSKVIKRISFEVFGLGLLILIAFLFAYKDKLTILKTLKKKLFK